MFNLKYPGHNRAQLGIHEQIYQEATARINAYLNRTTGKPTLPPVFNRDLGIEPMACALNKKKKEEACLESVRDECRKTMADWPWTEGGMKAVDQPTLEHLYDGFSKEGKGRKKYIKTRRSCKYR